MTAAVIGALVIGGAALSIFLGRAVKGGRKLEVLLLASFTLRVALAIGLYVLSANELPFLRDHQIGKGFWVFARDAVWHHENAARIAQGLREGGPVPVVDEEAAFLWHAGTADDFYAIVGYVYRILGTHSLYIPLLNAALWSGITVLVYLLARRLRGAEAGWVAALLVSVWPSSYVWSSQILKDTLCIFLVLAALFQCTLILGQRRRLWTVALVSLIPAAFLLARVRFYLLLVVVVAIGGAVLCAVARPATTRQWGVGIRGVGLAGLLLTTFLVARSVTPFPGLSLPAPVAAPAEERSQEPSRESSPPAAETGSVEPPRESAPPEAAPPETRSLAPISEAFSLEALATRREGFATSGGGSNVSESANLRGFWNVARFVPRAAGYALFSPFPWQWFSTTGDTGVFRLLAGIEVTLVYLLTPFILLGMVRAISSGRPEAWLLLVFTAATAIVLGLVVTNVGILFRLRLQFLIPLLAIVAAYGLGARRYGQA